MDEVENLLIQLNDADMDVRWKAALAADNVNDQRVVGLLLERLNDPIPAVRAKVAQSLRLKYDARIAPALLPLLADAHPEVRAAACQALGSRYYRQALEALLDRLGDVEAEVRAAAADALGRYYSRRAVNALRVALHDEDAEVRCEVVGALTALQQPEAVEPLLKLAQEDTDQAVRLKAIEGLGYLVRPHDLSIREAFFPEYDPVVQLLKLVDDDEDEIAREAIEALSNIGDERAVNPLVALLCDWDAEFGRRLWATSALGHLHDFRVTPILIAALSDPHPLLRPSAVRALAHLGDPAALPALDRLAEDADELGKTAAKAAAGIRYELSWDDFDRVVEYLTHGEYQERERALQYLSELDEPRARDLILKALEDALEQNDVILFCKAATILANAGDARALPLLARGAEFWGEKKFVGAVQEAEAAAHYLRGKLNGEELESYESVVCEDEDAEYELDDEDEDDDEAEADGV